MKRDVVVKISYCRFHFGEDVCEAVKFADAAARTADKDDREITISINYVEDDEEKEEGEEVE